MWTRRSTLGTVSSHTRADFVATLAVGRRPGTPGAARTGHVRKGHVKIEEGVPLAKLTTVGIGGPARALARPASLDELEQALAWAAERDLPVRPIGLGSNLLAADEGVDALVVRLEGELAAAEVQRRAARRRRGRAERGLPAPRPRRRARRLRVRLRDPRHRGRRRADERRRVRERLEGDPRAGARRRRRRARDGSRTTSSTSTTATPRSCPGRSSRRSSSGSRRARPRRSRRRSPRCRRSGRRRSRRTSARSAASSRTRTTSSAPGR